MIRRFSVALIALALCLPIFAAPVAAHGAVPFVVDYDEKGDEAVVGTVTSHELTRQFNVTVTAVWENGAVDVMASQPVFISNLAPHNTSPFYLATPAEAATLTLTSVTADGQTTGTKPAGGLKVTDCAFDDLTNVCTGNVTNDSTTDTALNVRVAGVLMDGAVITDAKESATIASLAPGLSAEYAISFDPAAAGTTVGALIAKTNPAAAGAFLTSWNNYFGDLGNTSESFVDEIAFMVDEGITTGCGNANFCPRQSVTRAQMAVFLDRSLSLVDDNDPAHPFTDVGTLSPDFQQAIQNMYAAGITGGCGATTFCPNSNVTRGQMSKFIVTGYGYAPIPGTPPFTDDNGNFSEPYNNRMSANGITTGCGTNLYCPGSNVLREQMAVFIYRAENFVAP